VNRRELQELARIRIDEARVLLRARKYDGAYYLAGYAVECALKACIARRTKRFDFPDKKTVVDSHTHDLKQLLRIAELDRLLAQEVHADPEFGTNWATVANWSEHARYQLGHSKGDVEDLYAAIAARKSGILRWLKKYW